MRADRSSKVTGLFCGTPQRPCARSSRAISSVSTFQDHRAIPAASVAMRKRSESHIPACNSPDGILLHPLRPARAAGYQMFLAGLITFLNARLCPCGPRRSCSASLIPALSPSSAAVRARVFGHTHARQRHLRPQVGAVLSYSGRPPRQPVYGCDQPNLLLGPGKAQLERTSSKRNRIGPNTISAPKAASDQLFIQRLRTNFLYKRMRRDYNLYTAIAFGRCRDLE